MEGVQENILPGWEYNDLLEPYWPKIEKVVSDFDILMIGQNHGLPSIGMPGEGLATRLGIELLRRRRERPIGFFGIEEFLHPQARPRPNRWEKHEIGPYLDFLKKRGIEIVPIDSVYSDPNQREEEIAMNISRAYKKYDRGIVIIGAHHAIRLMKPVVDSLSSIALNRSASQLIEEADPNIRITKLICLKNVNPTGDIEIVTGQRTSEIEVSIGNGRQIPLGGIADMAVLFP